MNHETTESYIYEMKTFANVCFPREVTAEKLRREQRSMHPELKLELFLACRAVEHSIREDDKARNTHSKLLPSTKLGICRNEPQRNAKPSYSGKTSVNPN